MEPYASRFVQEGDTMEKTILAVNCEGKPFQATWTDCKKYDLAVRIVESVAEAVGELAGGECFLLVLVYGGMDILEAVRIIRNLTNVPVLVLQENYDGAEKIAAIKAGADEYIRYPDTTEEWVASVWALIRRYMGVNHDGGAVEVYPNIDLCINRKRRLVIINRQEIRFPRKEFDLFCLLASNPGQVFTNEQLYKEVWKMEYLHSAENSLNSCLRRVRRKLEQVPGITCRIVNRRGMGYCFMQ